MAVAEGRITLDDKYSIVVGDLSYDLVVSRLGKNKKGEETVYEKNVGYYGTLRSALNAYARADITERMRGKTISLEEAVKIVQEEESRIGQMLQSISPSDL